MRRTCFLAPGEAPSQLDRYACADHASLQDAMRHYLDAHQLPAPRWCAIGIANPVVGDLVRMTNHDWQFSIEALRVQFGMARFLVINETRSEVRRINWIGVQGDGLASVVEREARLTAVMSRSSDVALFFDRDGTIRWVSPAITAALGLAPDNLLGTNAIDLVHPEDRGVALRTFGRWLEAPSEHVRVEFRFLDPAGRVRWVEQVATDLTDDPSVGCIVANLRDDLTLSSWKGLTGGYMSQLIIRPLTEILNDYTEIDYRDLQSIPLQLSADEMRQFIYHALELYWGYSGRYFFLTNNCADESLRLLQTVLPGDGVQRLEVLTPLGLRDTLINNHVADSSVLKDRADRFADAILSLDKFDRIDGVTSLARL